MYNFHIQGSIKVLKYESMKGQASPLVLSSFIVLALPANGHNYQPKHVIVNEINK